MNSANSFAGFFDPLPKKIMNQIFSSQLRLLVPVILIAFFACGVGGGLCFMPPSEMPGHTPHPFSHQSSPANHNGDCPDQLLSSTHDNKEGGGSVLLESDTRVLSDIIHPVVRKILPLKDGAQAPFPNALLFVLFSVFLN